LIKPIQKILNPFKAKKTLGKTGDESCLECGGWLKKISGGQG